jgi:OmpA-OmpF porin, OOP family
VNSRWGRVALGLLAFFALYLITLAWGIPHIQNDLTGRVEDDLEAAGVLGVTVDFDGRDGTLRGPEAQRDPALAAVTDHWGIRSLEYEVDDGGAVATTTTVGQVTVPAVITTPSTTSTTSTTTTTTSTTTTTTLPPETTTPASVIDASAAIDGATITLSGVIPSATLKQAVLDAANAGFTPQGQVVDQLQVVPVATPPAAEQAALALADAITAASPRLGTGSLRATVGALQVEGQAFNQPAGEALAGELGQIGNDRGIGVGNTVTPNPPTAANLQGSLDTVMGRAGILFPSGSTEVSDDSAAVLDTVAASILAVPDQLVDVRGHTDDVGSAAANVVLSESRAASVVDELVARQIPPERLSSSGAGETEPIAPNDTEEGRARNRRIEFRVLGS